MKDKVCYRVLGLTFGSNGNELDALARDEVQGLVDVGDFVESHLAPVWFGQGLPRDHLEQEHQLQAVTEVFLDIVDRCARLPQVRVTPSRECLKQK